jgi:hypothetical protein
MSQFLKILLIALVVVFALKFSGCNEQPSKIAINLLPDTSQIKGISSADTQLITSQRVFQADFPLFNVGGILIGKSNGISAAAISSFAFIPDTLDHLKIENIENVKLTIFPHRYAFGDTNSGYFGFDIYRINRRWAKDTTTYDSLFVVPANYYDPIPVASWSGKILLKDSLETVSIDLTKELIIEWLRTETVFIPDSGKEVKRIIPNYGLILVPHQQCNVIHRFYGNSPTADFSSLIKVEYRDGSDSLRELNLISGVDMTFLDIPMPDTSYIVMQNGANYWTELEFDLSMIPQFSGIHKTQLTLHFVPELSYRGNIKLDTTVLEANYFIDDYLNPIFQFTGSNAQNINEFFFPSFTSAVQYWNRTTGKGSLIIMPHTFNNQTRQLDRYVFYGLNHPDVSKRPSLKVIYSTNPSMFE